jgi:signal peptidase II
LDIGSKSAVFAWLSQTQDYSFSLIDGFLQFILRENSGAAFSAFQGWTKFLIIISCVAMVVVIGIFFSRKITSKTALFALGFITAGIIGNLHDRLFNDGRVRDFIDVYVGNYHWPTFNVADSLLCIGVGLLVIVNFTASTAQTPDSQQKAEP